MTNLVLRLRRPPFCYPPEEVRAMTPALALAILRAHDQDSSDAADARDPAQVRRLLASLRR